MVLTNWWTLSGWVIGATILFTSYPLIYTWEATCFIPLFNLFKVCDFNRNDKSLKRSWHQFHSFVSKPKVPEARFGLHLSRSRRVWNALKRWRHLNFVTSQKDFSSVLMWPISSRQRLGERKKCFAQMSEENWSNFQLVDKTHNWLNLITKNVSRSW